MLLCFIFIYLKLCYLLKKFHMNDAKKISKKINKFVYIIPFGIYLYSWRGQITRKIK